jgi:hypothetical protein
VADSERVREVLSEPLTAKYLEERASAGWQPYAIEWTRTAKAEGSGPRAPRREEIPYGMKVSEDRTYLEEEPDEVEALLVMLEGIVEDRPFSRIAEDLTVRGLRQRGGSRWTQIAVFDTLPRLIDFSPNLFRRREWADRRARSRVGV